MPPNLLAPTQSLSFSARKERNSFFANQNSLRIFLSAVWTPPTRQILLSLSFSLSLSF